MVRDLEGMSADPELVATQARSQPLAGGTAFAMSLTSRQR